MPELTKERRFIGVAFRFCFGNSFQDELLRESKSRNYAFLSGLWSRIRGFTIGGRRLRRKTRTTIQLDWRIEFSDQWF